MGIDKETSKLIALHIASQKSSLRKLQTLWGNTNNFTDQFIFDFVEAYARCRQIPMGGANSKYWREISDNDQSGD